MGIPSRRAFWATAVGSAVPEVFLPSDSRRSPRRLRSPPEARRSRAVSPWIASTARCRPVAHRRAAVRVEPVDDGADLRAVRRRRELELGVLVERDETDLERRGKLLHERARGALRGGQAVRLDVGRAHRARDVGDEHHRRLALGLGDRALGARDGEHEDGQRGEHEGAGTCRRQPGRRRDDVGHERRARKRGGGLAPAALDGGVEQ
jgi:hypothetical protein